MIGNSRVDISKASAPKSLSAFIVGLILCYQAVNYIMLNSAFRQGDTPDSEAGCMAEAGLAGPGSLCIEAQLFRGWHDLPDDEPEVLKHLLESEEKISGHTAVPAQPKKDLQIHSRALRSSVQWSGGSSSQNTDITHSTTTQGAQMRGSAGSRNSRLVKSTDGNHHKNFTDNLIKLQKNLEAKLQVQANKHAEHRALRALAVASRGKAEEVHEPYDGMTPFAHSLDDLTHDIQHHMEVRNKERAEHAAARAASHDARVQEAVRAAAAEASVQDAAPPSPTTLSHERQFHEDHHTIMSKIKDLGRELCQDPARHSLPVCAQFIGAGTTAHQEPQHQGSSNHDSDSSAAAHMQLLEKNLADVHKQHDDETKQIQKQSIALLKELCSDPVRRSYPTCVQLLSTSTPTTSSVQSSAALRTTTLAAKTQAQSSAPVVTSAKPSQAQIRKQEESDDPDGLSWEKVVAWTSSHVSEKAYKSSFDNQHIILTRRNMRGQWQGKIPSVACIWVVPRGELSKIGMKYFMNNFGLQSYEGALQLVIVYHKDDIKAAQIVQPYVNGTSVKAAAARGEGEFPSATAYRYGAWLANDADVVAQWDFGAWHHPHQLSMQVRALAIASRPASIIPRVANFSADGSYTMVPGGFGRHGTMVGEASWMRKNWMPMLIEERHVMWTAHSRDVAMVDMPELLGYHNFNDESGNNGTVAL